MQGPGVDISSLMGGIMMPPPPPMNTMMGGGVHESIADDDDMSDIMSISGDSTGGEVKDVNVGATKPKRTRRKRRRKLISNYYINDSVLPAGGTGSSCSAGEACHERGRTSHWA